MAKKVSLKGKKIRLFFHTDLDGSVAASIIQLYSGAQVVKFVPCPFQNYPKGPKLSPDVLDVFVDCRSRDRDEDIRIDHHASGEDAKYLKRTGIIVDTKFRSAVSLVAKYLGVAIDSQILEEIDNADSGVKNVFSKFTMDNISIHKIILNPGFSAADYHTFEFFKDKLLSFMVKGFAIEDLGDTPKGYERTIKNKFKVAVDDIKNPNAPLIKIIHSPTRDGLLQSAFTLTDSEFYDHILPYVQQHYYVECTRIELGVYVIVGFLARNHEFDEKLIKVVKNNHPEPYQIFVARSAQHTTINIGELIQKVKAETGITNGGGRDSVGGVNTGDKQKAIHALGLIVKFVEEHAP